MARNVNQIISGPKCPLSKTWQEYSKWLSVFYLSRLFSLRQAEKEKEGRMRCRRATLYVENLNETVMALRKTFRHQNKENGSE